MYIYICECNRYLLLLNSIFFLSLGFKFSHLSSEIYLKNMMEDKFIGKIHVR